MNLNSRMEEKGQVIVIIGIVIALSLYLMHLSTDFEAALQERETNRGLGKTETVGNIRRELAETHDLAVKGAPSLENIMVENKEFYEFIYERLKPSETKMFALTAVHHNETGSPEIALGAQNFLGVEVKNLTVNSKDICGPLEEGNTCVDSIQESEWINISYDARGTVEKNERFIYGNVGNDTFSFYRIRVEGERKMSLIEKTASTYSIR